MLKDVDNIVLIALVAWAGRFETQGALASLLGIPPASLTRSLDRLALAQLLRRKNLIVQRSNTSEYLTHGMRFVFPARIGSRARGVPTAHSAPPLSAQIASEEAYVWAAEFGTTSGLTVSPLHARVPALCVAHPELHSIYAALDGIRIGRARERQLSAQYIQEWLRDR